jgi:hypothetical protein
MSLGPTSRRIGTPFLIQFQIFTLDIARVDVDAHRRTGEARRLVAAPGPVACRRGLTVLALRATQRSSDETLCTPLHV